MTVRGKERRGGWEKTLGQLQRNLQILEVFSKKLKFKKKKLMSKKQKLKIKFNNSHLFNDS